MSGRVKGIPDFTKATWHDRRTDEQLADSILDGKGSDIASFSDEITKEQARGLIAFIRAFGRSRAEPKKEERKEPPGAPSTEKKPEQKQKEEPASDEPESAGPSKPLLKKLTRWLGKSHPVSVHFPIALIHRGSRGGTPVNGYSRPCFCSAPWFRAWERVRSQDQRFTGLMPEHAV